MNKKLDHDNLNIPEDDIECWIRYPKYRWVYELSRLLDSQHISWSPFSTNELSTQVENMSLTSNTGISIDPGHIYVKKPEGIELITEVYVVKGEVKHMQHISPKTGEVVPGLVGEIELRLIAFVTLHFAKFTGVFSAKTFNNEIYKISLKPHSELSQKTNQEIIKLTKRIYRQASHVSFNGLTDRASHELIAS